MKKYLAFTLKRYIPLFVVTFALCFFTFITPFGSAIPTYVTYHYYNGESYFSSILSDLTVTGGTLYLVIPVAIISMVLPFFANSYRYSLQSADTFYQIGKNKKAIRWTNNLVLLGSLIVSFTVAFIFAVSILLLRQLPNIGRPDEVEVLEEGVEIVTHYLFFNFGYYVPTYFLIVIFIIANYAISYFFVTRANNLVDSMIMLVLGEFILGVGVMTPFWFTMVCSADGGHWIDFFSEKLIPGTRTACFVSPIAFIFYLMDGLISGQGSLMVEQLSTAEYTSQEVIGLIISFVSIALFFLMAAFGVYKFLKEKESSGEQAGKPIGRDRFQEIIFHMGFGIIGLWIGSLQSLTGVLTSSLVSNSIFSFVLLISEMGFYSAAYYVFYGLLRRNFRLNKRELFLLLGVITVNLIIGVSLMTASTINLIQGLDY